MSKVAPIINSSSSKKGYVLAALKITDSDKLKAYGPMVPPTLAKYEGKLLQKTLFQDAVYSENEANYYTVTVLLQFPSEQKARDWYHSDEYGQPKALRLEGSEGPLVIGEGFDVGDNKAFVTAILKITDRDAMAKYDPMESAKKFKGTPIMKVVAGQDNEKAVSEDFEGTFNMAAFMAFPTLALASAWMASDEYQEMLALRLASSSGPVAIVGSV